MNCTVNVLRYDKSWENSLSLIKKYAKVELLTLASNAMSLAHPNRLNV